ncbi:MAG: hypothetical protein ACOY7U_00375 [Acidobacteriota bacterium]|uniref:Cap15 family cyclic dinucleotide receptor domain-containing protein n=1 Tax=Thermoanaerobaculum aquaticum TaxID=1312852 RepID=UPI0009DFDCA6
MHQYATDSQERRNVIMGIALLSVALAFGLHRFAEAVSYEIPWWIDAPSIWGISGTLYAFFDKWLWRHCLLRKVGVVRVPDLGGKWRGRGFTSFEEGKPYEVELEIRQTWTRLSVHLETAQSISRSLTASLSVNEPEGPVLTYEYRNEPKPNAPPSMHSHRGTAVLRLRNNDCLEGEYYSGRDRQNYGSLRLKRVGHVC